MPPLPATLRRVFITLCMLTRTTEWAAGRVGAGYFLPALFVLRYASMGGLDPSVFAAHMRGIRSFKDETWCTYWNHLAQEQLRGLPFHVPELGNLLSANVHEIQSTPPLNWDALRLALAPLGAGVVELMQHEADDAALAGQDAHTTQAAVAVLRGLVKAITYYQVSAFPGETAARMRAYHLSRRLFDELISIVAPVVGISINQHEIQVGNTSVKGYLVTPPGSHAAPLAIITNGLEGTVQELAIPLLKYHAAGLAVFFMEMPGTYAYQEPMSAATEAVYHGVIDQLAQHPRVDPERIGFVGVSFGGYWAARMAATSPRLRCVVACGAPSHRSFQLGNSIGIPDIIVRALMHTTGTHSLHALMPRLRGLSLRKQYRRIKVPLLVINGDNDTLLSTQDSVDLATEAPLGELKLYPNDDHCAMGHYHEWLALSQTWMLGHLLPAASPP